jgi:hypothetical protein
VTIVNLLNSFLSPSTVSVMVGEFVASGLTGGLFPSLPSDVQEGDLLIMRVGSGQADAASELAGWQRIAASPSNFATLAYIVVGPSPPATSATISGTRMQAQITRYRLPGTPAFVAGSGGEGTTSVSAAPSITIPGDAGRVLVVSNSGWIASGSDLTPSTTMAAASLSALPPNNAFPSINVDLDLPVGRWLAEGAVSSSRTGQTRSMHGFSVADYAPPAATGAFSNTHTAAGVTTAMACAVFKF